MCLGVPGRVERIYVDDGVRMAQVDFGGVRRQVCLEYLPKARVGDYVIVHVGFAISILDQEDALDLLRELRELVE